MENNSKEERLIAEEVVTQLLIGMLGLDETIDKVKLCVEEISSWHPEGNVDTLDQYVYHMKLYCQVVEDIADLYLLRRGYNQEFLSRILNKWRETMWSDDDGKALLEGTRHRKPAPENN